MQEGREVMVHHRYGLNHFHQMKKTFIPCPPQPQMTHRFDNGQNNPCRGYDNASSYIDFQHQGWPDRCDDQQRPAPWHNGCRPAERFGVNKSSAWSTDGNGYHFKATSVNGKVKEVDGYDPSGKIVSCAEKFNDKGLTTQWTRFNPDGSRNTVNRTYNDPNNQYDITDTTVDDAGDTVSSYRVVTDAKNVKKSVTQYDSNGALVLTENAWDSKARVTDYTLANGNQYSRAYDASGGYTDTLNTGS